MPCNSGYVGYRIWASDWFRRPEWRWMSRMTQWCPVMESSRTCPWPRGCLRIHFQVLGLGLVKFSMTHRCTVYWHHSEESSYDSCKDRYKCQFVPILTICNNASDAFVSQAWCSSTSSLTWRPSTGKGRHGTDFWVYAVCPWPWPWPCHLCPWLHHLRCLRLFRTTLKEYGPGAERGPVCNQMSPNFDCWSW